MEVVPLERSPEVSFGRLVALLVQAAVPTGLLVLFAYMLHSEGMTPRNIELILQALAVVRSHGGPWVVIGDFNCAPEELSRAMPMALEAAGAVAMATGMPTHFPDVEMAPQLA